MHVFNFLDFCHYSSYFFICVLVVYSEHRKKENTYFEGRKNKTKDRESDRNLEKN